MSALVISESALLAALLADWQQTLVIAKNPTKWHEYNKILGAHPSPLNVNEYFAFITVALLLIIHFLPDTEALELSAAAAVFEGAVVARNFSIGIK